MLGFREITTNKSKTSWRSFFRKERQIVKKYRMWYQMASKGMKE